MLIKWDNNFYDELFIFRHFDHSRRLMFTKFLNRKTCNFYIAKRSVYQWQGLFCFVFFSYSVEFLELIKSQWQRVETGENIIYIYIYYSIKYIYKILSSTYIVLKLNIGASWKFRYIYFSFYKTLKFTIKNILKL